ncbi:Putative fluoride ion transporter CrcB [Stieleria maiorica]|uniref:Fluoride-specific ion channel FluC n=1 Tax=Stieleria maiorica TaxID=2795974 RepID=A0A5B9MHA2_9BACT|nr:CrcB family protein [Stieleria maiorica]QEG00499.1 Putative fluoride ion transporter CrcB [Stieleria maiorica]
MTSWLNLAAIALGGAAGSLCRYGVTLAAAATPGGSTLLGTTLANIIGCGLLGALSSLAPPESESIERLMLALRVGFLGSLTTFSTFAAESTMLAGQGRWGASGAYILANLVLGYLALILVGSLVRGWIQT